MSSRAPQGFSPSMDLARTPEAPALQRDLTGQFLAGRYQLLDIIGGGGMGTVYRAVELQTQRELAVKVLDPRFDPAKDPIYRERFLREARLMTRLAHDHIVEVLDTGETDDVNYIAMELLSGRTLGEVLEGERILGWERALKLLRQIGAGLAFAHDLGLVHRDLKPANCFVTGHGDGEWVKLLDFGLAKPLGTADVGDNEVTRTATLMGSPAYMAPEQARGETTVQADLYAVGIVLFRMLAGQVPFHGATAIDVIVQHIQAPVPWLREVAPAANVPMELELVMRRCLEKDPRARYGSVQALLAALDEAEADAHGRPSPRASAQLLRATAPLVPPVEPVIPLPPPPSEATVPPQPREPTVLFTSARPARGGRWLFGAAALAAAGVGAGFFLLRSPSEPPRDEATRSPSEAPAAQLPPPIKAPAVADVSARAPGPVTFRISSIPPGATVKVGAKVMGVTPTTFEIPPDATGEATVELTLEEKGYQTITFIATSPGPRFDLVQRMQKGTGKVLLGKQAGSTPATQEALPPGSAASAPPPEHAVEPSTAPAPHPTAAEPASPVAAAKVEPTLEPLPTPKALEAPALEPTPGRVYASEELTSRPRLLDAGPPPRYTPSARVARSEGTAVARCVVNVVGRLQDCQMLKSVPLMDEAILASFAGRRYEAGKLGNHAVPTEIKIVLRVQPQ